MIDWTKPVRTRGGEEVVILSTKGPGKASVIGHFKNGEHITRWYPSGVHNGEAVPSGLDLENIPEAVAPVEIQEVFEEGYEAGCNHPFGNDISKATAAWHNSASKQINIGKRVV